MLYIFLIVRVIERGRYNRAARLGDRSSRDRGNPATAPTGPFLCTNLWKNRIFSTFAGRTAQAIPILPNGKCHQDGASI